MKKLYIAIGCLALMQTSAFSLTFKLGESIQEPATLKVGERVREDFYKPVAASHGRELYNPSVKAERVSVIWKLGEKEVDCNRPDHPIAQDQPLEKQFSEIRLIYSPMKQEHVCVKKPINR